MAEISKELENMLTEFLIREIGSKALDGITYSLLLKNNADKESIEEYKKIKLEANKCGFKTSEIFRMYEIGNGYIFDMDVRIAKIITAKMVKTINKTAVNKIQNVDIISDMPEKRRKRDIISLGRYVVNQYNNGRMRFEVALFSKNSTNRIVLNGVGPHGEPISVIYNAYAIRHWDIEVLNGTILIPQGIRVAKIEPCEILPSKTGVSFIFTLESTN